MTYVKQLRTTVLSLLLLTGFYLFLLLPAHAADDVILLYSETPVTVNFTASGSHQQEISWTSVNPIENASNYRFIGLMVNPNNESTWFDGTGSQPCYIRNITQTSPNTFTGSVQLNSAADWSSELSTTFKMVAAAVVNNGLGFDYNAIQQPNGMYTAIVNFEGVNPPAEGSIPVYRVYNPQSLEHLYTPSKLEVDTLVANGWADEGVAWYSEPAGQGIPTYRLYSPVTARHLYTTDASEVEQLIDSGNWNMDFDGQPIFGATTSGTAVYRLYNDNIKTHLLTTDQNEYNVLPGAGWKQEGIAFYAF